MTSPLTRRRPVSELTVPAERCWPAVIGTLVRGLDAAPTLGGAQGRFGELAAAGLAIDHRAAFHHGLDLYIDAIAARHDLGARA